MFPLHSHPPGLNQKWYFFWSQIKAHIFLIITQKFQLQIHYMLAVIAENVPIFGIPILIFLCIFITGTFPVSHSYFCPRRENKNLVIKLYKMCLRSQGWSVKSESTHVKIGTSRFNTANQVFQISVIFSCYRSVTCNSNICSMSRYTGEIPEPGPFLSQHGAQTGDVWVFP